MRSSAFWSFIFLTLLGGAVLVLFGLAVLPPDIKRPADGPQPPPEQKLTAPTVTFIDQLLGPRAAKVTIVEFGDFACPFCRDAEGVLKSVLAEFPRDVRLVWKDFPVTNLHPEALRLAMAARCAGEQKKFWEYHDLLFANQERLNQNSLLAFARQLGLDERTFSACLDSEKTKPLVTKNFEEGVALGVDGTPYLFINGERLTETLSLEKLKNLIETELKKP